MHCSIKVRQVLYDAGFDQVCLLSHSFLHESVDYLIFCRALLIYLSLLYAVITNFASEIYASVQRSQFPLCLFFKENSDMCMRIHCIFIVYSCVLLLTSPTVIGLVTVMMRIITL